MPNITSAPKGTLASTALFLWMPALHDDDYDNNGIYKAWYLIAKCRVS